MSPAGHEFLDLQLALAGEYSIERELGRGGMGVVFLAKDVQLDRHVAIKVLPPQLADEDARARFLREARTAAALSHPHIVPIHRVGEAAGYVYFVMSYVAGETLGDRLRSRGPLPAADAIRVMREVAWALAYAHGHGIVHRDVKPDNILLEEGSGRALVTDFGIARVGATTLSTDAGKIMGTAQFMSPEQATSETIDGRSDLYALGVVGYLAVSGKLPFEAANVPALLMKHVAEAPKPISDVAPGLPRALVESIHKCLEKDPEKRFSSGEALAAALEVSVGQPRLPAPLRAWLSERNPATIAYAVWSGLLGIPILYDLTQFINYQRATYLLDLIQMGVLAAAPIIPMIQFHATRARRLFRAGFTLNDLRGALDVAAEERRESEALDAQQPLTWAQKTLRVVAYGSLSVSMSLTFLTDSIRLAFERQHILIPFDGYRFATMGAWVVSLFFFSAMNANQVPLLPESVRKAARGGLRDRLWRSRIGDFFARRLGAPGTSRAVGVGVFQATEMALAGAAADLYAALPSSYREQLPDLPSIVAALESRAQAARVELSSLDLLDSRASTGGPAQLQRRDVVKDHLARSVAALESIRIDLLRLHAGAADLAPLTTLLDAARLLGEDASRLSEAQREVDSIVRRTPRGSARVPTPA